ncbi:DUF5063 domain-containing protein [Comamonas sp. JC664]|uniref:DUF5063 domain-containing protein n=1 Tax=Comamonas sp. JC664 TaxID=2801917 RepID=UPI001E4D1CB9
MKRFLDVLDPQRRFEDRERALRAALDGLALAYHSAEAPFDGTTHSDAPWAEANALRAGLAVLFPDLGLYNEVLNIVAPVGELEPGVGDALDDLTDIAVDMHRFLHQWETTGEEAALWHFRFSFETHWGRHLRGLQLYLHERAC